MATLAYGSTSPEYIIVQAGGKGSRLGYLTANRPKCLVPVENRPMLFHLFEQFPDSRFIIIGDTHFDVLRAYLDTFAKAQVELVRATGSSGTLAGIAKALELIPSGRPFMLIWSDLILPGDLQFPVASGNYIGIGENLPCRWKFENGQIVEQASSAHGVAGLFLFEDKMALGDVPKSGQLVKWIAQWPENFQQWRIAGLREFGLLEEYARLPVPGCRPFNQLDFNGDTVCKRALTVQGEILAEREANWYRHIRHSGFPVPNVHDYPPLVMEKIAGLPVFESQPGNNVEKGRILRQIIGALQRLHSLETAPFDYESYQENYIDKTFARLQSVCQLIPFADSPAIIINGRKCRNPLYHKEQLVSLVDMRKPQNFCLIHGDPTFSNILLTPAGEVFFIDPRGYFGKTELFGDAAYDYAKLYYSLVGNYDSFNRKNFRLRICPADVTLFLESGSWEQLEEMFISLLPETIPISRIRLLHTIIWLSLTTYVWEDYDAICAAFYNGVQLFEDVLNEHNF